jgi:inner membrane protein
MTRATFASSTTLKLFVLGALSLLLLIPLSLIYGLVQERAGLAGQAEARIAAGWGREQNLLLPMLRFDYSRERSNKDHELIREHRSQLLSAADAKVRAGLVAETRQLGIYALPIYTAQVAIDAHFDVSQMQQSGESDDGWALQQVSLLFAPGDLTGLREIRKLSVNGLKVQLRPSAERWNLGSVPEGDSSIARPVLAAVLAWPQEDADLVPISLELELAGARALNVVPNAAEFELALSGDWPHPGFAGGALPRQREISDQGFSADWRLLDLSTGIPTLISDTEVMYAWGEHAVGVALVEPGGLYQQNERSAKYGILVLALTMAALFLTEVLVGVRLHPFHYALVGLALAVFYLLLLALSEHVGFVPAYLLAAGAVVAMVAGYSAAVLHGWARGALGGGVLAALYGFLLVLIQAEELSLLLGAIGLALLLATAMYLTRRLDWYSAGPELTTDANEPTP